MLQEYQIASKNLRATISEPLWIQKSRDLGTYSTRKNIKALATNFTHTSNKIFIRLFIWNFYVLL